MILDNQSERDTQELMKSVSHSESLLIMILWPKTQLLLENFTQWSKLEFLLLTCKRFSSVFRKKQIPGSKFLRDTLSSKLEKKMID